MIYNNYRLEAKHNSILFDQDLTLHKLKFSAHPNLHKLPNFARQISYVQGGHN